MPYVLSIVAALSVENPIVYDRADANNFSTGKAEAGSDSDAESSPEDETAEQVNLNICNMNSKGDFLLLTSRCCRASKSRKTKFKLDCARVGKRRCLERNMPQPRMPAPLMGPRWSVDGTCGPTQKATSLPFLRPLVHTSLADARIALPSLMVRMSLP